MLSRRYIFVETSFRIFLICLFMYSEDIEPFRRIIQNEEWWYYKNPMAEHSTISTKMLYSIACCAPILSIIIFSGIMKSARSDVIPALLASSFAVILNGLLTNAIKVTVGRPRPDFFFRCFPEGLPDGQPNPLDLQCTGDPDIITEGRKSFPSGHSSVSFSSLGFCTLYILGKLQCFNSTGRGHSWKVCLGLLPAICALLIAISRTCDYRHHWQDVTVGSILGMSVAFFSYRQYYPALNDPHCHLPLVAKQSTAENDLYSVSTGSSMVTQATNPLKTM